MPGRWLLPLGAGSQPRLNLPTPLTAQPPAITDGSVRRQPDNLCSRRRYILGARRVPPHQCSLRYVINLSVRIGTQFRRYARQLHSLWLPVERCRLAELRAAAFGKVNTLTA
jgi:hypothetical protein